MENLSNKITKQFCIFLQCSLCLLAHKQKFDMEDISQLFISCRYIASCLVSNSISINNSISDTNKFKLLHPAWIFILNYNTDAWKLNPERVWRKTGVVQKCVLRSIEGNLWDLSTSQTLKAIFIDSMRLSVMLKWQRDITVSENAFDMSWICSRNHTGRENKEVTWQHHVNACQRSSSAFCA